MSFKIYSYSIEQFQELLIQVSTDGKLHLPKQHITYFNEYFAELEAKTILVEYGYVDKDYLEDYVGFYSRSFSDYPRKCHRLHFFDKSINQADFDHFLHDFENLKANQIILQRHYLGFMVLKPLPQTVIGRTCLKTYKEEHGRHFPTLRKHEVNLFGTCLSVETVPFQEQDSVTAACATTSLWSAFQVTGPLFQHKIASPVEITKLGAEVDFTGVEQIRRTFPSEGLNALELAHVIKSIGLEAHYINPQDLLNFKCNIYAYLRAKIPLLLLYFVLNDSDKLGTFHVGTVLGYCLEETRPPELIANQLALNGTRITKIYIHDDQLGPFSKLEFNGSSLSFRTERKAYNLLDNSWILGLGRRAAALPRVAVVPLHHKIRIVYENIRDVILDFDTIFKHIIQAIPQASQSPVEWDIYLSNVSDFKKDIAERNDLPPLYKTQILVQSLPRFIWRAVAKHRGQTRLELLFDGTGIVRSSFFLRSIDYDFRWAAVLKVLAQQSGINQLLKDLCSRAIFDHYGSLDLDNLLQ